MTETRHTADTITDPALEQLYAERDRAQRDARLWADCVASAERVRQHHAADADRYEAELRAERDRLATVVTRVRDIAADMHNTTGARTWARALDDALTGATPASDGGRP